MDTHTRAHTCTHIHTHTQLVANYPVIYPAPVALTTQTKTIVFQVSQPLTAPVCLHREKTLGRAIQAVPWLQHNTLLCVSSFFVRLTSSFIKARTGIDVWTRLRKPQASFPFFYDAQTVSSNTSEKVFIHCVYTDSSIPLMIRFFKYLEGFGFFCAYPDLRKQDK